MSKTSVAGLKVVVESTKKVHEICRVGLQNIIAKANIIRSSCETLNGYNGAKVADNPTEYYDREINGKILRSTFERVWEITGQGDVLVNIKYVEDQVLDKIEEIDKYAEDASRVILKAAENIEEYQELIESILAGTSSLKNTIDRNSMKIISLDENSSGLKTSTQVSDYKELAEKANNGDKEAQQAIIDMLLPIVTRVSKETGYPASILLAQIIEETGWLTTDLAQNHNNVLGVNDYMIPKGKVRGVTYQGAKVSKRVPQEVDGKMVYSYEDMAEFKDLEECVHDFAKAYTTYWHPELATVTSVADALPYIKGYSTQSSYVPELQEIMDTENLYQYDDFNNNIQIAMTRATPEYVTNSALEWATDIANDSSHGYSMEDRYGPDYDCSSFVINAYKQAGVDTHNADTTSDMVEKLTQNEHFVFTPGNPYENNVELKPGDILWKKGHTEMYYGDGKTIGAHSNYDSAMGDSEGNEINIQPDDKKDKWEGVIRYTS